MVFLHYPAQSPDMLYLWKPPIFPIPAHSSQWAFIPNSASSILRVFGDTMVVLRMFVSGLKVLRSEVGPAQLTQLRTGSSDPAMSRDLLPLLGSVLKLYAS